MPSLERLMQDKTERHVALAKETHRLMLRTVESKGLGHYKHHGIDGYIVPKSISSFIWTAYHSLGGDEIIEHDVDIVRAYLKVTRNVVSLQSTPAFRRTFVRAEWNDSISEVASHKPTPEPDAIARRAERLQPHEVGEDREPAPVEVRKIVNKNEYVFGERPLAILALLETRGRISDPQGYVASKIADMIADPNAKAVSHSLSKLHARGLLTRKKKSAKRTTWIEITEKGQALLDQARERGFEPTLPDDTKPVVTATPEPVFITAKAQEPEHGPSVVDHAPKMVELGLQNRALMESISQIMNGIIEEEIEKRVRDLTEPMLHVRKILRREDLSPIQMLSEIETVVTAKE